MTPDRKAFLRDLPHEGHIQVGAAIVHLVHGSPRKINEYLMSDRDERTFLRLAETETDDALVFGHTHEQWHREYGGVLFVAVGSVGRPKDGDPRAMYTMLRASEGTPALEVEALRVAYDVEGGRARRGRRGASHRAGRGHPPGEIGALFLGGSGTQRGGHIKGDRACDIGIRRP